MCCRRASCAGRVWPGAVAAATATHMKRVCRTEREGRARVQNGEGGTGGRRANADRYTRKHTRRSFRYMVL